MISLISLLLVGWCSTMRYVHLSLRLLVFSYRRTIVFEVLQIFLERLSILEDYSSLLLLKLLILFIDMLLASGPRAITISKDCLIESFDTSN